MCAEFVAKCVCDALIAQGTTSAAVYSSSHVDATDVLFASFARRGLRGLIGLTLMDQAAPQSLCLASDLALSGAEELIDQWHGYDDDVYDFVTAPRFAVVYATIDARCDWLSAMGFASAHR